MLKQQVPLKTEPETDPNAPQQAVALKYDMERDMAPKVVAKGRGHVAENILAAAQKSAVPVYQNKTLVNMLMALEIDREIPPELYRTIAEVMAYVYRIDKKAKKNQPGPKT
ncbi:MAG: EscU/YscU/HrcU family type III secretion system export apparatus switch protein [Selenomonas sp.]|uniref:EscU/YscU/HrcU family type III secretion system export apparatus switch protein n=1 Tax=Selenomonas sp. TaxID=2053611 RepID=UPI0025E11F34|nr:EscU/YscU/HrcU family type III secretion system export apparatus switch protein [Selenomonas sp.]MCR5757620.1 EscU/YscU/HrcU family type III secretion system export apparatus switch protein [Selenomonas sp.]